MPNQTTSSVSFLIGWEKSTIANFSSATRPCCSSMMSPESFVAKREADRRGNETLEQTFENSFENGIFQVAMMSFALEFEDRDQILMIEQDLTETNFRFFWVAIVWRLIAVESKSMIIERSPLIRHTEISTWNTIQLCLSLMSFHPFPTDRRDRQSDLPLDQIPREVRTMRRRETLRLTLTTTKGVFDCKA